MPADLSSMDAVLKDDYTPEQQQLASLLLPKPAPEPRVTNHVKARILRKETK